MKTILFVLGILILNSSLSYAQTKKIALRSHSGANANFTIHIPDEFGLGPTNYEPVSKKKRPIKVKPLQPGQIQLKDSITSIQYCTPQSKSNNIQNCLEPTPKSKPKIKEKRAKKRAKKVLKKVKKQSISEEFTQQKGSPQNQLAGFSPSSSSEPLLILCLSISAFLFFIFSIKKT